MRGEGALPVGAREVGELPCGIVELVGDRRAGLSLVVRQVAGVVSTHVENPFAGEVTMRDGLPVTSKGDSANHGFGVRSMQLTVERYGGTLATLATLAEDGRFHVNAIIPTP